MDYKTPQQPRPKAVPRLIIHGGAGNIQPDNMSPEKYRQYREALLTIVRFPIIVRVALGYEHRDSITDTQ